MREEGRGGPVRCIKWCPSGVWEEGRGGVQMGDEGGRKGYHYID